MAQWTLFQGDFGVVKTAQILNSDGTVKDLTSLTAKLKVTHGNPPSVDFTVNPLTVSGAPTNGTVLWTVGTADGGALAAGTYTAEIQLFQGSTYLESVQISLVVLPNA